MQALHAFRGATNLDMPITKTGMLAWSCMLFGSTGCGHARNVQMFRYVANLWKAAVACTNRPYEADLGEDEIVQDVAQQVGGQQLSPSLHEEQQRLWAARLPLVGDGAGQGGQHQRRCQPHVGVAVVCCLLLRGTADTCCVSMGSWLPTCMPRSTRSAHGVAVMMMGGAIILCL